MRAWYVDIPPVPLASIPVELRIAEGSGGPFDRGGAVNQGYLFPLSVDFTEAVATAIPDVATALETLTRPAKVWMVRAGKDGESEETALTEGVALIGWQETGDLAQLTTPDAVREVIDRTWPQDSAPTRGQYLGQIEAFLRKIEIGDWVILPRKTISKTVAVGRIVREYEHRPELPVETRHTRKTIWVRNEVPYDRFPSEMQAKFGLQGTVREINLPNAAALIQVAFGMPAATAERPLHLVLKWSATYGADTVEKHQEVADAEGFVWWRRRGTPGSTGLAEQPLKTIRQQLGAGVPTTVFLHSSESTWKTTLHDIQTDESAIDPSLVLCTFTTIDCLKATGWKVDPLTLFGGSLRLNAHREGGILQLYYQGTPQPLSKGSLYLSAKRAHNLAGPGHRPDIVLRRKSLGPNQWLVIEVKGGKHEVARYAVAALQDLLAYRRSFEPALRQATRYGVGIAFGRELQPDLDAEVALCTPDTLAKALAPFVS